VGSPLLLCFFIFQVLPKTVKELVEFDEWTIDEIRRFLAGIFDEIKRYAKHKKDRHLIYDYDGLMNRIEGLCTSIEKNEFVRKVPEELALFIEWRKCRYFVILQYFWNLQLGSDVGN
jgi:hypothetical protein